MGEAVASSAAVVAPSAETKKESKPHTKKSQNKKSGEKKVEKKSVEKKPVEKKPVEKNSKDEEEGWTTITEKKH